MGNKRASRCPTWNYLHHRGFYFHKAARDHELTDSGQNF
ncbi:Uncharacterised protein [Shigella sonnei]|nr:Uncharacterised protein [Shigella sonnei]CSG38055.1 Uncharacterised protein [Shigella sonnei]